MCGTTRAFHTRCKHSNGNVKNTAAHATKMKLLKRHGKQFGIVWRFSIARTICSRFFPFVEQCLSAFFLSAAAFSWNFPLLFYLSCAAMRVGGIVQEKHLREVWLLFKFESLAIALPLFHSFSLLFIPHTHTLTVLTLTKRWHLQWDYNCLP